MGIGGDRGIVAASSPFLLEELYWGCWRCSKRFWTCQFILDIKVICDYCTCAADKGYGVFYIKWWWTKVGEKFSPDISLILPSFKIISGYGFSRYITFTLSSNKRYVSKKDRVIYILK
jgi:hypothetical protein